MMVPEGNITYKGNIAGKSDRILPCMWNVLTEVMSEGNTTSDLFVLRFYGPVNPVGSSRARSVYLATRLLGRNITSEGNITGQYCKCFFCSV